WLELQTKRLNYADAVDVGNDVVAHYHDLALLAYFVRDRSQYGMPPRGTKGRADDLRGQRHEMIANYVALGPQRLLKKAAFLQVSDKPMRGWKRQGKRIGDLRHRDGLGLPGNMPDDGKRAVERPICFRLRCHRYCPSCHFTFINYQFSE